MWSMKQSKRERRVINRLLACGEGWGNKTGLGYLGILRQVDHSADTARHDSQPAQRSVWNGGASKVFQMRPVPEYVYVRFP